MYRKVASALAVAALLTITSVLSFTNHSYVTTPSMYPTIPPGSMIFVKKQPEYHVGDVIEFRNNAMVWAHRIVAIEPGGALITKGDNPQSSRDIFDQPTTRTDVVGKVVAAPRWLGFPQLIVSDPAYGLAWLRAELGFAGRLLLVGLVGLLALVPGLARQSKKAWRSKYPEAADPVAADS